MNNVINDEKIINNMAEVRNKFMVFSGKGGVGKTTVAVNLAYSIMSKGYKVGLLDIDIHGPNVVKMMGLEDKRLTGSEKIEPIGVFKHMKIMSTASMLETEDSPIIWRGPLKMKLIRQFLEDVNWGKLDFMIIDSPPGTGDEPLSIAQLMPGLNGGIVVTTPQKIAILDAKKSIRFAQQLNIPFIGLVENMSGFICPHCNRRIDIFKTGGGMKLTKEMGIEFLGRIPYDPQVMLSCDDGIVYLKDHKNGTAAGEAYSHIAKKIINLTRSLSSSRSKALN
jgi:Mrp family chromosome partitioning ATPase